MMDELWNSWDLQPPPVCTTKSVLHHSGIEEMKTVVHSAISVLKNLNVFHKEVALLSRYLYKYKRLFRHDKGFHYLVQINQSLQRYLKLDLLSVIVNFKECLPARVPVQSTHAYLPTQQMLKWMLMRMIAFSKIFLRILHLSKMAGKYIYGKMALGWSATYVITSIGILSRISTFSRFFLLRVIHWYNSLREKMDILQATADLHPFCALPNNLEDVIGDVELKSPVKKANIDKIFELIDLTGGDEESNEIEIMNELIDLADDDDEIIIDAVTTNQRDGGEALTILNEIQPTTTKRKNFQVEDLGEPVLDLEIKHRKRKKKNKSKKFFNN